MVKPNGSETLSTQIKSVFVKSIRISACIDLAPIEDIYDEATHPLSNIVDKMSENSFMYTPCTHNEAVELIIDDKQPLKFD